jgi:membrane-associated phospholipid phosphatase
MKNKIIYSLLLCFILKFNIFSLDYFEAFGDIGQYAIPLTALGISLINKDFNGSAKLCIAYLTTIGLTYALKYSINKTRPDDGLHSFPSGHTSSSFCGASFLGIRYGPAYGIPAYTLSCLVGWSRIRSARHYPEDVIAGAAIGIITNIIIDKIKIKNFYFAPVLKKQEYSLIFNYKF